MQTYTITYQEFKPHPRLTSTVNCYWWFDAGEEARRYIILPDGSFDLIVTISRGLIADLKITGIWGKQVEVVIPPFTQLFGIRYCPIAADKIFKKNIASILDGAEKLTTEFWQIEQLDFANLKIAIETLEDIMIGLLTPDDYRLERSTRLFKLLKDSNGSQTITYYAEQCFWTARQINRYFNTSFGLSLKAYCMILRSFESYKQIKKGEIFPHKNFYDQSHFINQTRQHTGHTPKELYYNKNDRFLQLSTMTTK